MKEKEITIPENLITIPENLATFLKDHNALEKYQANFDPNYGDLYFSTSKNQTFIIWAFDWEKSPEGWDYWNDLDDLWQERLHTLAHPIPALTAITDSVHRRNTEERAAREKAHRDYLTEISK